MQCKVQNSCKSALITAKFTVYFQIIGTTVTHRATNFGGGCPEASGLVAKSPAAAADAALPPKFLCWLEHEGARPETGVKPVPPSIKESKLKGIPADGVVMGTPATSESAPPQPILPPGVKAVVAEDTGKEEGRCGGLLATGRRRGSGRDWSCRRDGFTSGGEAGGGSRRQHGR